MAEIIHLKQPATKTVTYEHGGQKYTCTFDPNAPVEQRWVWYVDYVKSYRYVGSAPTMEKAGADARKKIHALNKFDLDQEEAQ